MSQWGELGAMVEAWRSRRDPRPSISWIGDKCGVKSRSTVKPWLTGESMPGPEPLRALARLIGIGYRTALDAALLDAGYLEEREYRDYGTPTRLAPDLAATSTELTDEELRSESSPPPGDGTPGSSPS